LFISSLYADDGLSFQLKAANPSNYDHNMGGGSWSDSWDYVDGYYYACGDRLSIFVKVTASSSWKGTSSVATMYFGGHPALTIRGVSNACAGSPDDCVNGGSAMASLPKQDGSELQVQISKMSAGSVAVIRIDFSINCYGFPSDVSYAVSLNSFKVGTGSKCDVGIWLDFKGTGNVLNCDDGNACTTDSAVGDYCSRYCSWTSKDCDDGSACTTDSCDPSSGKCSNIPITCDDGIACTTDTCNAKVGCQYTKQSCCDGNACTLDECDPYTGCVYTTLQCDDGNPCTDDKCDPNVGCVISAKCCCDGNAYFGLV
jgi:hypothetical protein